METPPRAALRLYDEWEGDGAGHPRAHAENRAVVAVEWAPDDRQLVSATADELCVWNARTGERERCLASADEMVSSVAWSGTHDGRVATGGIMGRGVTLWNVRAAPGEERASRIELGERVSDVAWSGAGGGTLAAAQWRGRVTVCDAAAECVALAVLPFEGHEDLPGARRSTRVAWAPPGGGAGGNAFLLAAAYGSSGRLHLYDTRCRAGAGARPAATWGGGVVDPSGAAAVTWSVDGQRLACSAGHGRHAVIDARTFRPLYVGGDERGGVTCSNVTAAAYSGDGRLLAVARRNRTVSLWDAGATDFVQGSNSVRSVTRPAGANRPLAVAWSRRDRGSRLALACETGVVRVLDVHGDGRAAADAAGCALAAARLDRDSASVVRGFITSCAT